VLRLLASDDERDLARGEREVRAAFSGLDLDLRAITAVSNIFRAAAALRQHLERGILAEHDLSWSAFTAMFLLRVRHELDARTLADEVGVSAATLTGVMKTLESRGLLRRRADRSDKRRVIVSLTTAGKQAVDAIMPGVNHEKSLVTQSLTDEQLDELGRSLRTVLRTVGAAGL
jgi:MarR family transcriptional regulator, organic hydroperoxide resistance regulator